MTCLNALIAERERLWDDHPIITESAILPTRPVQNALARVLALSRKKRASIAFWAAPVTGKSSCLRAIKYGVQQRIPGCGVLELETVEDRQQAEGRLLEQILRAIKDAPKIDRTVAGKRDQVCRALIAMAGPAKHLFILLDEAQEFTVAEFAWLKHVINGMTNAEIKVTTVIFGQEKLKERRQELYETHRADLGERFMKKLFEFKGCREQIDLQIMCEAIDQRSSYPADTGWTFAQLLFPKAYTAGFRFVDLVPRLWEAIRERVSPKNLANGLPMEVIAATLASLMLLLKDLDGPSMAVSEATIAKAVKQGFDL